MPYKQGWETLEPYYTNLETYKEYLEKRNQILKKLK